MRKERETPCPILVLKGTEILISKLRELRPRSHWICQESTQRGRGSQPRSAKVVPGPPKPKPGFGWWCAEDLE